MLADSNAKFAEKGAHEGLVFLFSLRVTPYERYGSIVLILLLF